MRNMMSCFKEGYTVEVAVGEEITGAITAVRKLIGVNYETN